MLPSPAPSPPQAASRPAVTWTDSGGTESENNNTPQHVIVRNGTETRNSRSNRLRTLQEKEIHEEDLQATDSPELLLPQAMVEWRTTRYSMNTEKALQKKLLATIRQTPCSLEEAGNGWNIHCQAGLYELARRAICRYYANFKVAGLEIQATVHQDKQNCITQVTFKIKTYGGQSSYVVDLFHTTSSLRISGRNHNKFFQVDWPRVNSIIENYNKGHPDVEADVINRCIRDSLEQITSSVKRDKKQKSLRNVPAPVKETVNGDIHGTSSSISTSTHNQENPLALHQKVPEGWDENDGTTELTLTTHNLTHREMVCTSRQGELEVQHERNREVAQPQTEHPIPNGSPNPSVRSEHPEHPVQDSTATAMESVDAVEEQLTPKRISNIPYTDNTLQAVVPGKGQAGTPPTSTDQPNGGTGLTEQGGEPPQTCMNCRMLRTQWNTALLDIQHREKKCNQVEKTGKARDKEMERLAAQVETQKAVITGLEARTNELCASNRILQQIIEANGNIPNGQNTTRTTAQPTAQTTPASQERNSEEVNFLKAEIRNLELERRITEKLTKLEDRLSSLLAQPKHLGWGNHPQLPLIHHPIQYPIPMMPFPPPMHFAPAPIPHSSPPAFQRSAPAPRQPPVPGYQRSPNTRQHPFSPQPHRNLQHQHLGTQWNCTGNLDAGKERLVEQPNPEKWSTRYNNPPINLSHNTRMEEHQIDGTKTSNTPHHLIQERNPPDTSAAVAKESLQHSRLYSKYLPGATGNTLCQPHTEIQESPRVVNNWPGEGNVQHPLTGRPSDGKSLTERRREEIGELLNTNCHTRQEQSNWGTPPGNLPSGPTNLEWGTSNSWNSNYRTSTS